MKRFMRKFKKVNKFARFTYIFVMIAYLVSFIFFAKSIISLTGIETFIRYIILLLLFFNVLSYFYICLCKLLLRKYPLFYLWSLINVLLIIIFSFSSYFIDLVYDKLSSFNENEKIVYTSYLISLKDTSLNAKSVIGKISDKDDIEGYILADKIIDDNDLEYDIKSYSTYLDMLYSLYAGNVDAIFVSSNYGTIFGSEEDFANIKNDTKVLYQASKEYKNTDYDLTSNKSLTEPFSVLILGVDSEYEGLNASSAFNGDTLIVATINPVTLSATLFSIPRDTYVPIACNNDKLNKINSAAAYGTSCVIETIENLIDIPIDYYVKINFKGVVDLVDALGGVTVDVQAPDYQYNHGVDCKGMVCEQNSDRKWGEDTVYIPIGVQVLDGEQALAYARCRYLYITSDFARNQHQQDIIMALSKKIMEAGNISKFEDIFKVVEENIATNMSTSTILSAYNMLKSMLKNVLNKESVINIQKTYLETYNLPVYLPSVDRITSALGYYEDSLKDITKAMKINLEIEKAENIKTFSYSLNEEYTAIVPGKNIRTGLSNEVYESFIGKSKEDAKEYCAKNDFNCSFKYIDDNSPYYDASIGIDLITYQDPVGGSLVEDVATITFYINGAIINEE